MRVDVPRSLLAGAAAVLAALAAVAASRDGGMSNNDLAVLVLAFETVVDLAFALVPSRIHWSGARRAAAAGLAVLWALTALPLLALTGARAACSCGDPSTGYMLPTLFNVAAYQWILCASLAGVVLMAATAVRGWNQFAPAAAPTPLAK